MVIIPAIDIIDGQCVRLTQGDYEQKKVYDQNPVAVAQRFEAAGIRHLHVVDLDGARSQHLVNQEALLNICQQTQLNVDFGGGLKSEADIEKAFECGAQQVTIGTLAVKRKDLFLDWLGRYGSDKIILGADVKHQKVAISGWLEESQIDLFEFLDFYQKAGISYVICTDISKDGLLQGTALPLYQKIRKQFPQLHLIASGGITSLADLKALKKMGCYGAIVGKAFYEGTITLEQLSLQNWT